jgi:hypothetical protein
MPRLTLELPQALSEELARRAAAENKTVEQLALERLAAPAEPSPEEMATRYDRFIRESGLFHIPSEEEKRRYEPVPEEELRRLAARLGAAGPLSAIIMEERGEY